MIFPRLSGMLELNYVAEFAPCGMTPGAVYQPVSPAPLSYAAAG